MKAACQRCQQELNAVRAGDRCPHCGEVVSASPGSAPESVPPEPGPAAGSPPARNEDAAENLSETSEWLASAPSSLWGAGQSADNGGIGSLLTPPQGLGEIGWLGPYRILKVLGIGGMGVVFQAQDPASGTIVAIKGMLPAVAAKEANRQRFMQEARATATVRHENLIAVHSVGEDRGLPYLVMEFLEGETLQDRLVREMQLPIDEVLRIALEAAEGLDAAHKAGLVHRDIKPANIWLEREAGRVKILDFGLARATAEDTRLTLSGVIMGTPAFMAPEQARGVPVDYRADLFSLGSVLYRMCTGQMPFDGRDTFSILTALAVENPRPPHLARPDIPGRLANLVMTLLAKRPDDRPATARAVCDTLRSIQRDQAGDSIFAFDPTQLLLEGETSEAVEDAEEEAPEPVGLPQLPLDRMHGLVGREIGRYSLEQVLGRGHHGVVFRARERDGGPQVALKVLSPTFPHDDKELHRFSEVVKTWLTLRHPNLVAVQNAGRSGPYCWIALELVEGESLDQLLRRTGTLLDWKLAVRAGVHLGRALQATRERRIIHGSVNPRNILLRRADGAFGLNDALFSKVLEKSILYRDSLDGRVEAEAAYLSPEQLDGGMSFVDHLCDLYSLGVVVYVLVTGRPPFQGETVEETFDLIRTGSPTQPRKYQKAIPREFERTILKMIARNQEDRYQSPDELLVDLNRIAVTNRVVT